MQWLVTGCSSGLGLELARAILASGHKCIASSRNPSNTPSAVAEIGKLGGHWVILDVSGPDLKHRLALAVQDYGMIDVLVNNAGYALDGVVETLSLDAAHAQMDTNFFGPLRTIKALVPSMRERKSGVIINVSSGEFWFPHPVASVYAASKFALEGMSEALYGELAGFGIRVLIAEPGAIRTSFMDPATTELPELPEAYQGTMAEYVLQAFASMHGNQDGDAKKMAQAVVKEVLEPSEPALLRLALGKESWVGMKTRGENLAQNAAAMESVALAADF